MSNKAQLRVFSVSLGAAGSATATQELSVVGSMVFVYDASTTFLLSWDNNAPLQAERGLKFNTDYNVVKLENTSTAAIVVKIILGFGDVDDYRSTVKPLIASTAANIWSGPATVAANETGATLVEAANLKRVELIVHCDSTNTVPVYVSAGNVGLTNRMRFVMPGEVFRVNYTGPVYIFTVSGVQNVYISKTEY